MTKRGEQRGAAFAYPCKVTAGVSIEVYEKLRAEATKREVLLSVIIRKALEEYLFGDGE